MGERKSKQVHDHRQTFLSSSFSFVCFFLCCYAPYKNQKDPLVLLLLLPPALLLDCWQMLMATMSEVFKILYHQPRLFLLSFFSSFPSFLLSFSWNSCSPSPSTWISRSPSLPPLGTHAHPPSLLLELTLTLPPSTMSFLSFEGSQGGGKGGRDGC